MEAMRAVVFDAYGTLFDVQDAVAAVCERRFPGYGKALGELWRRKQVEYTWLCSRWASTAIFGGLPRTRWRTR